MQRTLGAHLQKRLGYVHAGCAHRRAVLHMRDICAQHDQCVTAVCRLLCISLENTRTRLTQEGLATLLQVVVRQA